MLATANRIVDSIFTTGVTTSRDNRSIENPAVPLTADRILEYIGGGSLTPSGMSVSDMDMLSYSPVWHAVDLIAGDISTLRLITYESINDNTKRRAVNHPTFGLMRRWTGELTSNLWLQCMMTNALLYGGGYSRIYRESSPRNWPERLEFIPAYKMTKISRSNTGRKYEYKDRDDKDKEAVEDDMFHLPGLMLNDIAGLSVVSYARNTVGRLLSGERFTDDFFANGLSQKGMLTKDGGFASPEAKRKWADDFRKNYTGPGNRHRIPMLDQGIKWVPTSVTPEDALLIDLLQWGPKEVAGFFKLPPHKLGDDTKTSYNSIEQENLAYFTSTLLYWANRIEFEANHKLFRDEEKSLFYVEFLTDTFLRADSKTRAETQNIRIMNGSLTRNESRAQENQNPLDGLDEPLQPLNMGIAGEVQPQQQQQPASRANHGQAIVAVRDLLVENIQRVMRCHVNDAARAAKKPERFLTWLNDSHNRYHEMFRNACRTSVAVAVQLGLSAKKECATTLAYIADRATESANEAILTASEVREERLVESVNATMDALMSTCSVIANDIVYGSEGETDDS